MQQKSSEPNHYPKDEIDLRDLLSILSASKRLIFIVTLLFTIAASVYAFSLKPTYKVTTLISNAQYEVSRLSCNAKLCVEVPPSTEAANKRSVLIKEIKKVFADRFNNLAENKALITNLKLADIHNIEFTTEAISKEVAIKQASEIVTYVQNENDKLIDILKGQSLKKLTWINAGLTKIDKNIDLINFDIDNIDKMSEIVKSKEEVTYVKYKSELRKLKLGDYYDSNFLLNDISIWLIRNLPNVSVEKIDKVQNLNDAFALINKNITEISQELGDYYDSNFLLNDISIWLIRNLPNVSVEKIDKVQNLNDAFALINKNITEIGLDKVCRDSLINTLNINRNTYIKANKYNDSLIPFEFDLTGKVYRDSLINTLNIKREAYIKANKYDDSLIPIEFDLTENLSSSDAAIELASNILDYNRELLDLNKAKNLLLHKLTTNTELTTYNAMLKMQKLDFEFLLLDTSYYNSEIIKQSVSEKASTKYPRSLLIISVFLLGLVSASFVIISKSALTNYLNSIKK